MTSRPRAVLLAPVLVLALLVTGCGPFGDDGPDKELQKAVDQLVEALPKGDVSGIAFTEDNAVDRHAELWKPLASYTTEVEAGEITEGEDDRATATLQWTTSLGRVTWEHTTEARLVKSGDAWKVDWEPSLVEESLADAEKLVVTGLKATRGDIVGAGGEPLVELRSVVRFGIDKAQAAEKSPGADLAAAATRLANLVDITPGPFVKAVTKAGPKAYVEAVVLRQADVSQAQLAGVENIPGGRTIADKRPLAPSKDFAAALLGTVGPATAELIKKSDGKLRAGDDTGLSGLQLRYNDQLGGTSGVQVSAQQVVEEASDLQEDATPRVLFETEPVNGKPLELSLDRRLQTRAQQLLTRYGPASALVAVRPSTGEILAAASGPGSDGYNTATFGQYAPGSTFKVVSSLALLRAGLKPGTQISCPTTETVNGKRFKNYSDYPANRVGRITLEQAVANSCNTAFISSRDKVSGTALAEAGAALGFGVDHDMGFPAYFGQVPPAEGETEAAADLIGQGKILASPLAMVAVVASVVKGGAVVPDLVLGDEPVTAEPAKPLTKGEANALRQLMRAVVSEGSGSFLQSLGSPAVLAKTGTAEYGTKAPLPTHAWMIGAQGDLAVAVFVEDGQSGSRTAGPVLEDFLAAAK